MRTRIQQRPRLAPAVLQYQEGWEFEEMSRILDEAPEMGEALKRAEQDLCARARADRGRRGMTAEQVVRALVYRTLRQVSYARLAFELADSVTARRFCRFGLGDRLPRRSTLHENIKRLSPETVEAANQCILALARDEGFEDGSAVRADCTGVETNVHHPTDSSLLLDSVCAIARLLEKATELADVEAKWSDHTRRAKRRNLQITNAKKRKRRIRLYRDLLKVTRWTIGYAENVSEELQGWWPDDGAVGRYFRAAAIRGELLHFVELARRVIDQTERRVLRGESVPAAEKIFSIFEPHTDIIIKSDHEPIFGHKFFLSTGRSGLILDSQVLEGNPADSTLIEGFIDRHEETFGSVPRQAAFDGGFASKANLKLLKDRGVQDVAFHKKRGLTVPDMVRSSRIYRMLVRFRAGVEGIISFLKRCLGLSRCPWRGLASFKTYVKASVFASNLLLFARHRLTAART